MRRFRIYAAMMIMMLVVGYSFLVMNPPVMTQKVFKYPHWLLRSKFVNLDIREIGEMDFRAFDKNGKLLWEELKRPNSLADEGEYMFLDVTLRNGTAPSNYYLRLYNATPTDTSNLTSIAGSEASGNSYAAHTV